MSAFAGTLFLIIAWNSWRSTYRIVHNGIQTQGIVVENVHKPRRGLERQTTSLAPIVQFFTASGERKLYYSQTYTTPVSRQVRNGDHLVPARRPEPSHAQRRGRLDFPGRVRHFWRCGFSYWLSGFVEGSFPAVFFRQLIIATEGR